MIGISVVLLLIRVPIIGIALVWIAFYITHLFSVRSIKKRSQYEYVNIADDCIEQIKQNEKITLLWDEVQQVTWEDDFNALKRRLELKGKDRVIAIHWDYEKFAEILKELKKYVPDRLNLTEIPYDFRS